MEISEEGLAELFSTISPLLNERQRRLMTSERQRRLMTSALVAGLGRGGQARVATAQVISMRLPRLTEAGPSLAGVLGMLICSGRWSLMEEGEARWTP